MILVTDFGVFTDDEVAEVLGAANSRLDGLALTHKNHIVSARTATAPAGVSEPLCIADASMA